MAGSLESLVKYTRASVGDAINDHDAIARVRPCDVYAAQKRVKELEAIVAKLPKCWRLVDGKRVQDCSVVLEMGVFIPAGTTWCSGNVALVSDTTTEYQVTSLGSRLLTIINDSGMFGQVECSKVANTREAAEALAAKGKKLE